MHRDQLDALTAIVDHGTFEAAARALHVTPSAVSQRIKALEASVGQVVVRRASPCTPTDAGSVLVRMAREMALLEADARAALGSDDGAPAVVAAAVNADSLASWFAPILEVAAGWTDAVLQLEVEDESISSRLLRSGDVVGAVTSDPSPVSGCRLEALGSMRYVPVATPELRERHTRGRHVDLATMPCLRFNRKDDLQAAFLRERAVVGVAPTPQVPSSEGFRAAVRAGLGWGMLPETQLGRDLEEGRLIRLPGRAHRDVPLYWQVWSLRSPRIERLTEAIRYAARTGLRRP